MLHYIHLSRSRRPLGIGVQFAERDVRLKWTCALPCRHDSRNPMLPSEASAVVTRLDSRHEYGRERRGAASMFLW